MNGWKIWHIGLMIFRTITAFRHLIKSGRLLDFRLRGPSYPMEADDKEQRTKYYCQLRISGKGRNYSGEFGEIKKI